MSRSAVSPPAALRPTEEPALGAGSEVGALRRVIVHRPGPELDRITIARRAKRARREHDEFAGALVHRDVEVLRLADLLAETLDVDAARHEVLSETLELARLGPTLSRAVGTWLADLPGAELTTRLLGGVTFEELSFARGSLREAVAAPDDYVLTPLAGHLFTRDASAWIFEGVTVAEMARNERRREAVHLRAIYRHHPRFAAAEFADWSRDLEGPAEVEGGDVLIAGNRAVVIGMSGPTRPAAVELLARRLFLAGAARRVIAVALPATLRLDAVMTMVDRDAFRVHPIVPEELRAYTLRPTWRGFEVSAPSPVPDAIADALELPALRLFETLAPYDALAVAPGVVVADDRDVHLNARLRREGIEVIPVAVSRLGRARGGPRSLTCPIERKAI